MILNVSLSGQNRNKVLNFGAVHSLEIPQKYGVKTGAEYDKFIKNEDGNQKLQQELYNLITKFNNFVGKIVNPKDLDLAPIRTRICSLNGKGLITCFTGENSKTIVVDDVFLPLLENDRKSKVEQEYKIASLIKIGSTYKVTTSGEFEKTK